MAGFCNTCNKLLAILKPAIYISGEGNLAKAALNREWVILIKKKEAAKGKKKNNWSAIESLDFSSLQLSFAKVSMLSPSLFYLTVTVYYK
ncbi:hypothetical protein [Sporosalibacterium faouarense]|uniref:hypothetical protein n=1 Tax=Sporosalibacterium faouarense TaxID=516123 RepID=UPI00192A873C|nr:hypothetical protein [Sporosalibacterium faouarense]